MFDTIVIGGGMAGFIAACRLADRGEKVAVVSKGDPVCSLSTGCIDITDAGPDPIAAIDSLPTEHPYHLLETRTIQASIDYFRDLASAHGLPYRGSARENQTVLTPLGRSRFTALAPATMTDTARNQDLFLVSFHGMRDFYPSYFRKRFPDCRFAEFDAGVGSVMGLAARFDEPEFRRRFAEWLRITVPDGARVGVPAVLGVHDSYQIMEELETATGTQVFEIATIPPSVPGIRLFSMLKTASTRRGVEYLFGAGIAEVEKAGKTVRRIRLEVPGRARWIEARKFMLATGSFVSGGLLSTEKSVTEPVFGLPVFVPGERSSWFHENFFAAEHPVQQSGVLVDGEFRPSTGDWDNVFVCGSILAHGQIIRYQCGHGVAVSTAYAAADICAGAA